MPDVVGVVIRRLHVYVTGPMDVICPDCGVVLFRVAEKLKGGIIKSCRGRYCKDANGERKKFIIIFHTDLESYREAIERESQKIDISKED
jgi:hypothetical protein